MLPALMNMLLFCGSLRAGSLNKKLLLAANSILLENPQIKTTIVDLKSLNLPMYDGDLEDSAGVPENVKKLAKMITDAQAVVIASPEYNGSISGPLKNTIDWLSRLSPHPWIRKPVVLLAASPGALGGMRALAHSRDPLEALGAFVFPQPYSLPKADAAFSPSGDLVDATTKKKLVELLDAHTKFAKKLSAD